MTDEDAISGGEVEQDLATLKKRGVIDPAGTRCSLCQEEAGDCRPTPIKIMSWVPATCNECYRWIVLNELFDEDRDKELFYPDDPLRSDGGRPKHGSKQTTILCASRGHNRDESTFRTDSNQRLTVASCRRCGIRLGSWYHD